MTKTLIWAHRGASAYATENTMPSFELAEKMGADGIEIDIHLTKDGEIIVFHDDYLDNLTDGKGKVGEKTLKELKSLEFRKNKEGVSIPELREVYTFAKKHNLFVNTELKYSDNRFGELNEKALSVAEECGVVDMVVYSSFHFEPLMELKKSGAKVGLLYYKYIEKFWETAKKLGADAIHPYYKLAKDKDLLCNCFKEGIPVNPWTIDEETELETAFKNRVNAIITNKPDLAAEIREKYINGSLK